VRSFGDGGPYWVQGYDSNAVVLSSECLLTDVFIGGVDRTTPLRDGRCMRTRFIDRVSCPQDETLRV
jgi:hypothetical protein